MGDGMNCKPGELCIVIRANLAENLGRFVTTVEYDQNPGWPGMWRVECGTRLRGIDWQGNIAVGTTMMICDESLRPIRDNPGKDETLDWCPVKETA
jgi:hypothetical protein